jgi:aryl-alcohol dehydrogenase-like predicted oxidoreductase
MPIKRTPSQRTRRQFLTITAAGAGVALTSGVTAHAAGNPPGPQANSIGTLPPGVTPSAHSPIPTRALGRTGAQVSIMGIGGSHLGEVPDEKEAIAIVHEAIDAGINFFDNAWEYHDGRSEEILGRALAGGWRDKAFLMTKVCTHGRKADVAMAQLEQSLRRLGTDHLDLWQIHECIYHDDPELHFQPDGVIEALQKARQQGKTRFVGFTGHKDPTIHLKMLSHGFPFDTVQMPLNAFDASFHSFERGVLPEASRRGVGVIGMKSLGGVGDPVRQGAVLVEEALRYAMSIPGVSTTVTGVDHPDILRQNLAIARGFQPMSSEEMQALRERVRPLAADGRLELYKMTKYFDAKIGREQHGYPPEQELPL